MSKQPININIYDENGKLKPKDEFMKELEGAYNDLTETEEDEVQFLDLFADPEAQFDPIAVLTQYHFVERKLYLNCEIEPAIGRQFLETIQFWNAEDEFNGTPIDERIPIQIYIDCPGGCLTTSLLIIDAIRMSKTPIYTVVTGKAYSGGFFIAIAADKRMAFPNATFLFHEGSAMMEGDAHKISQQAEFYKKYQLKQIKELVLSFTKISKSTYEQHAKDDWYFGTEKALEIGVIDEISKDVNGGIYDDE